MGDNRAIGIFDSGVGGLTVTGEIMKILPDEKIVYFGDTARVPYGTKSKEIVDRFSSEIVEFLRKFQVKAIVIACNTISSNSYEYLKNQYDIPFFEVVGPGVRACLKATKNSKVGVIATPSTINSRAYEIKLKEAKPGISVYSKACPLFVPLAEEGITKSEITRLTVKLYLEELAMCGIDSLILGCTHYPLLYDAIKGFLGEGVEVVNPAKTAALELKSYLEEKDMLRDCEKGEAEFFVTDLNQSTFGEISEIAMGRVFQAKKAILD